MSETNSMASSQRTASSSRSRVGSRFFLSSFPVFPLFVGLESTYHFAVSNIGTGIQIIQMIAFVLNPHLQHGETLKAASNVFYMFQLPFWDQSYIGLSWKGYMPFFSIAVALIMSLVGAILYILLRNTPIPKDSWKTTALRLFLHGTSSILFIPMMQAFLSQMVCKNDYLWTFNGEKCYQKSTTLPSFIVAIISFICLNILAYVTETTLYNDDYDSQHPLARKHHLSHAIYCVWRTLTCILFHVLLSNSTKKDSYTYTWFPMYIFFSAVLMAISYSVLLPFIKQQMTRVFTASFLVLAMLGILTFFSSSAALHPATASLYETSSFALMDYDGLVALSLLVLCAFAGWRLGDYRINPELHQSLPQLLDAAAPYPQCYTTMFPRGLPEYDPAYKMYIDLCHEVADGAVSDNRSNISLETPFLTRILLYTDVEVSTRFLSSTHKLTGLYPTPEMLHLAAQIYVKGTLYYQESASVILCFAAMINTYTVKPSLALAQCERTNVLACTFPTRYRAYRLMTNLKLALHVRDTAYQRTCEEAKRAHKDILISLHQFWNKLLTQQDRSQLLTAYSMIAYKRERTNAMFLKALQHETSDRELLLKYADFLEQVMVQPERAEKLRSVAKQEADDRARNVGRPFKARKNIVDLHQISNTRSKDDVDSDVFCGVRMNGQNVMKIAMLLVMLGASIGLLVTAIQSRQRRWMALEGVEYSGTMRYLRLLGDLVAIQYWTQKIPFQQAGARLHAISAIGEDFLSLHNYLIFGDGSSGPNSLQGIAYRAPLAIRKVFASVTDYDYIVTSLLGTGFNYAQFIDDVPGVLGRNFSDSTALNVYEADAVFSTLNDQTARAWEASALNKSVLVGHQWYAAESSRMIYLFAIFFAVGIISIVVYVQVSLIESPVELMKNNIMSLFALIPRGKLQEITSAAKLRIENFDRSDVGDDDMAVLRMQEVSAATTRDPRGGRQSIDVDVNDHGPADGIVHPGEDTGNEEGTNDDAAEEVPAEDTALLWDKHHDADGHDQLLRRGQRSDGGTHDDEGVDAKEEESKASSEEQNAPRRIARYLLLAIMVLLGATVTILAAILLPLLEEGQSAQIAVRDRASLYLATQESVMLASFWMGAFFCRGDYYPYTKWLEHRDDVRYKLPESLSLWPNDGEVKLLRKAGAATDLFVDTQRYAKEFFQNPSRTVVYNAEVPEGEEARDALFATNDNKFLRYATDSMDMLREVESALFSNSFLPGGAAIKSVSNALIWITAAAMACVILLGFSLSSKNRHFNYLTRMNMALLGLIFVALMVTLILAVLATKSTSIVATIRREFVETTWFCGLAIRSYMWPLIMAGSIVQRGTHGTFLPTIEYFDFVTSDLTWMEYGDDIEDDSLRETFLNGVHTLHLLQNISIYMSIHSLSSVVPLELDDFTWDFDTEPDAMETRLKYPNDPLRYTTTADDLAKTPEEVFLMASDALSNNRMCDLVTTLNTIWKDDYHKRVSSVEERRAEAIGYMRSYIVGLIVCGAVGLVLMALFVISILRVHARLEQERLGLAREDHSITKGMWIVLAIIFLFIVAIFALGVAEGTMNTHRDSQLDMVTERPFYAIDSMIAIELWHADILTDTELRGRILRDWNQLDRLRSALITGEDNIFGLSSELDHFLQGTNVELSPAFRYGFDPATTPNELTAADWTFATGVEDALAQWMQRTMSVLLRLDDGKEGLEAMMKRLRETMMPLVRGLDEASHLLLEHQSKDMNVMTTIQIVLASLLIVVVIVMGAVVLIPAARSETTETLGYRMLLRLIPPDVREKIPAIREYMYSDDHYSAQSSSSASLSMAVEELAFPLIAINRSGIVIKFNRHAETIFGYAAAEVLGNNVSILMPERIGARHDSYLQKYCQRRPGNRRVFSERSLLGRKKSGELFSLYLTVHEMRRSTGDSAFIGYVRDIQEQVKLQREEEISRYIQQNATLPMIAIDSLGTILRFNAAAEECFGRRSADVLDQNVKILMPDDLAARHDGYLATYLRTKKKNAIDNITRSRGLRRTGEEFPIELKIKEINTDNVTTYIGFCRDLTTDANLEESILINDVILETSTVPIICTDLFGKVIYYSRAAERVFGYASNEVVNNNCKMLMPETVAENHDLFMEQYRTSWSKRSSPIMDREIVARHKSGHLVPVLASFHEIRSSSSGHNALVGFFKELTEDRQLERSLGVEEVAADGLQVPLIVINHQGIMQLVNRATCVEFGYREDELVQKNVKMLMPADVAVEHDDYLGRYMLTGIGSVVGALRRVIAQRKDGTTFPIELRVREVRGDDEEEDVHFVGFLRNLTKDIRLERQTVINDVTMDDSPLPLLALDRDGLVIRVNDATEKMFQSPSADIVGQNFMELLETEPSYGGSGGGSGGGGGGGAPTAGSSRASTVPGEGGAVDDLLGAPSRREIARHDGSRLAVQVTVRSVQPSVEGNIAGSYVVSLRDMSEDGAVEQRNIRSEKVTQLAPVPLLEFNRKGIITRFNSAAEIRFGLHVNDVVGQHVNFILVESDALHDIFETPPEDGTHITMDSGAFMSKPEGRWIVTVARCKDGTTFPVEVALCEIASHRDAKDNSFIAYLYDLNDAYQLRAASVSCAAYTSLSPNAIVVVDVQGIITGVNAAACRAFHYKTPSELIGSDVKVLMPDDIAAEHHGYILAYQKTGVAKRIGSTSIVQCKRSDGDIFLCSLTVEAVRAGSETIYIGRFVDRSEDGEVASAKNLQDMILAVARDALLVLNESGTVHRANEAAESLFGYESGTLVGRTLDGLIPGVNLMSGSRTTRKRAVTIQHHSGSTFEGELHIREVNVGDVRYFVACVMDLKETNELHGERKMNMAMMEHSPAPLLVMNEAGIIGFFAPAAEKFFDISAAEAVGMHIGSLLPFNIDVSGTDEDDDDDAQHLAVTNILSIPHEGQMLRARLPHGEHVPVDVRARALPPKNGEMAEYLLFLLDRRGDYELEHARNLSAALERGMPLPWLLLSESGVIIQVNKLAEEFFGYTAGEMISQKVSMIVPYRELLKTSESDDKDRADGTEDESGNNNNNNNSYYTRRNLRLVTKSGGIKEADASVCVTEGSSVAPGQKVWYILFSDHTATLEHTRAKQRLDALLKSAKTSMVMVRTDTMVTTDLNPAALRMLKCAMGEGLERPLSHLLSDAKAQQTVQKLVTKDAHAATKYPGSPMSTASITKMLTSVRYLGVDVAGSREFMAEVTVEVFSGSLILTIKDVDAHHRKQLHTAMLSAVESTTREPYMIVNEDDDIVLFNEAARGLLGYHLPPDGMINAHQVVEGGVLALYDRRAPTTGLEGDRDDASYDDSTVVLEMNADCPLTDASATAGQVETVYMEDEGTIALTRIQMQAKSRRRSATCRTADGRQIVIEMRLCQVTLPLGEGESAQHSSAASDASSNTGPHAKPRYLLVYMDDPTRYESIMNSIELGEGLLEKNPTAIVVSLVDGTVVNFNAAAERLFRFERSRVIGKNVIILMPDSIGVRHDNYLLTYLRTREQHVIGAPREVVAERRDGERFVATLNMLEILDDTGKPYLFIAFFQDAHKPVPRYMEKGN